MSKLLTLIDRFYFLFRGILVRLHIPDTKMELISHQNVLSNLEETYKDCASDNWDGYGAKAVSDENYCQAKKFLGLIAKTLPAPGVSVDPDGDLAFEWYIEPHKNFTVSVGRENKLSYAGLFDRDTAHGTVYYKNGRIPESINYHLEKLFLPESK